MLLNLVDKHWTGERSLHHNNNFVCGFGFRGSHICLHESEIINPFSPFLLLALAHAVQILSMMENDIFSRETEVKTLRREADALNFQTAAREEQHKAEVCNLAAQLEKACSAVVSGFCT